MKKQNILVAETEQRLDVALAFVPDIGSRNQAQKVIRAGHVTVDEKVVLRPSYHVTPGRTIRWVLPTVEPMSLLPQALPIDIVYEDESLLVINKPARMPVHPGAGRPTGTLVNALLHHVGRDLPHAPDEPFRPGIVHRLDMDTTGLLVVAKNDAAHRALQSQFEVRSVDRHYVGIVWGVPDPRSGTIDAPLGRSAHNRTVMAVRPDGRHAITHYETHEILGPAALVRFRLETGRTHQNQGTFESYGTSTYGRCSVWRGNHQARSRYEKSAGVLFEYFRCVGSAGTACPVAGVLSPRFWGSRWNLWRICRRT